MTVDVSPIKLQRIKQTDFSSAVCIQGMRAIGKTPENHGEKYLKGVPGRSNRAEGREEQMTSETTF